MTRVKLILVSSLILYHDVLCVLIQNDYNTFNSKIQPVDGISDRGTLKYTFTQKPSKTGRNINDTNYNEKHTKVSSENEDASLEESSKHEIPYSEHENPRDVPTRPEYTASNRLKHPKNQEDGLDFVPTKLYAQVRGKNTVKRFPQKYAVEEAETDEEKENANRLSKVVSDKKVHTIYTEEGYEDSAYDHAGHIRDASFEEDYGKKTDGGSTVDNKYPNDFNDPKSVVFEGISQLEEDISDENREIENQAKKYHDSLSQSEDEEEDEAENEEDEEEEENVEEDDERNEKSSDGIERSDTNEVGSQFTTRSTETENLGQQSKPLPHYRSQMRPLKKDDNIDHNKLPYDFSSSPSAHSSEDAHDFSTAPRTNKAVLESENNIESIWENFKRRQNLRNTDSLVDDSKHIHLMNPAGQMHSTNPINAIPNPKDHKSHSTNDSNAPQTDHFGIFNQNRDNPIALPLLSSDQLHFTMSGNRIPVFPDSFEQAPQPSKYINSQDKKNGEFLDSTSNTPFEIDISSDVESWTMLDSGIENPVSLDTTSSPPISNEIEVGTTSLYSTDSLINNSNRLNFTNSHMPYHVPYKYIDNPFLSPLARQLDSNLRRYTFVINNHDADNDNSEVKVVTEKKKGRSQKHIKSNAKEKKKFPEMYDPWQQSKNRQQSQREMVKSFTIMKPPQKHHFIASNNNYKKRPKYEYENRNVRLNMKLNRPRLPPTKLIQIKKPVYPITKIISSVPLKGKIYISNRRNSVTFPKFSYTFKDYGAQYIYPNDIYPYDTNPSYATNFPYNQQFQMKSKRSIIYSPGSQIIGTVMNEEKQNSVMDRNKRSTLDKQSSTIDRSDLHHSNSLPIKRSDGREEEFNYSDYSPVVTDEIITRELAARFPESYKIKESTEEEYEEKDYHKKREDTVEVEDPDVSKFWGSVEKDEREDDSTAEVEKVDPDKYPYYNSKAAKQDSNLRYIINPNRVPKKTFGGMEFYDSRTLGCSSVEPDLEDVTPEEQESRGYNENLPRLNGLGDKIDCFKAKYFDSDPLDNPLFREKNIKQPILPDELDPRILTRTIPDFESDEEYIHLKHSKKPEIPFHSLDKVSMKKPQRQQRFPESVRSENLRYPRMQKSKVVFPYLNKARGKNPTRIRKKPKYGSSNEESNSLSALASAYGKQVYDDVMDNIQNSTVKPKRRPDFRYSGFMENQNKYMKNSNNTRPNNPGSMKYIPDHKRDKRTGLPLIDITTATPIMNYYPNLKRPSRTNRNNVMRAPQNPNHNIYHSSANRGNFMPNLEGRRNYGYQRPNSYSYKDYPSGEYESHNHRIKKRSVENDTSNDRNVKNFTSFQSNVFLKGIIPPMIRNDVSKVEANTGEMTHVNKTIKNGKSQIGVRNHAKFSPDSKSTGRRDVRRNEPRYNPDVELQENPFTPAPLDKPVLRVVIKDAPTVSYKTIDMKSQTKATNQDEAQVDGKTSSAIRPSLKREPQRAKVYHEISRRDKKSPILLHEKHVKPDKLEKRYEVYEDSESPKKSRETQNSKESRSAESENVSEQDTVEKGKRLDSSNENNTEDSSAEVYSVEDEKESTPSRYESSSRSEEHESEGDDKSSDKGSSSRYSSRPYSPPEFFEDKKYAHLGPRVNKPGFHHPPFVAPKYERSKFEKRAEENSHSDESTDREESKESEKFSFPWDNDKEEKESKHYVHTIKKYEYPWDRRERLAREKKKRSEMERRFSSDEGDEEISSSEDHETYLPWYLHPRPSRSHGPKRPYKGSRVNVDNESVGSRIQPVTQKSEKSDLDTTKSTIKTSTDIPIQKTKSFQNVTGKKLQVPVRNRNSSLSNPTTVKSTAMTPIITNATRVRYVPAVARSMKGTPNVEILKTNPKRPRLKTQPALSSNSTTNKPGSTFQTTEANLHVNLKRARERVATNSDNRPTFKNSSANLSTHPRFRQRLSHATSRKSFSSAEKDSSTS